MSDGLMDLDYLQQLIGQQTLPIQQKKFQLLLDQISQANNPGAITQVAQPAPSQPLTAANPIQQKVAEGRDDRIIMEFTKAFITKAAIDTGSINEAIDLYVDTMKDIFMKEAKALGSMDGGNIGGAAGGAQKINMPQQSGSAGAYSGGNTADISKSVETTAPDHGNDFLNGKDGNNFNLVFGGGNKSQKLPKITGAQTLLSSGNIKDLISNRLEGKM